MVLGSAALAGVAPIGLTGDIEVFWPSPTSRTVAIGESVLQMYQGRDAQTAIGGGAARNTKKAEKVTAIGASEAMCYGLALRAEIIPKAVIILL